MTRVQLKHPLLLYLCLVSSWYEIHGSTLLTYCIAGMIITDPIIILLTGDIVDKGVNLSWSQESQYLADVLLRMSLRVSNGSYSQEIPWLNKSSYYFTVPEGAPACEVYNFSVTATYVGAIYTEADCSVTSSVLTTMLPSLPNISRLDSTLGYMLTKHSAGFALYISFEVCIHTKIVLSV